MKGFGDTLNLEEFKLTDVSNWVLSIVRSEEFLVGNFANVCVPIDYSDLNVRAAMIFERFGSGSLAEIYCDFIVTNDEMGDSHVFWANIDWDDEHVNFAIYHSLSGSSAEFDCGLAISRVWSYIDGLRLQNAGNRVLADV